MNVDVDNLKYECYEGMDLVSECQVVHPASISVINNASDYVMEVVKVEDVQVASFTHWNSDGQVEYVKEEVMEELPMNALEDNQHWLGNEEDDQGEMIDLEQNPGYVKEEPIGVEQQTPQLITYENLEEVVKDEVANKLRRIGRPTKKKFAKQTEGFYRHQCSKCLKDFPLLSVLKDHILTCFNLQLFKCKICGKSSNTKSGLTAHLKGVHQYKLNAVYTQFSCKFMK